MFKVITTRNKPPKNICSNLYYEIPTRRDIDECEKNCIDHKNKIYEDYLTQNEIKIEKASYMCKKKNSNINHDDIILIQESNEYMKRLGRKDRSDKWKELIKSNFTFQRNEIAGSHLFNEDLPDFFERRTRLVIEVYQRLDWYTNILIDIYENLKKIHVCDQALRFFRELNIDVSKNQNYDITYPTYASSIYRDILMERLRIISEKNTGHSYKQSSFLH